MERGAADYFTDDSANPENGTAGATFVTASIQLSRRMLNVCSSLQTELVAILYYIEHPHRRLETMCSVSNCLEGVSQLLPEYVDSGQSVAARLRNKKRDSSTSTETMSISVPMIGLCITEWSITLKCFTARRKKH